MEIVVPELGESIVEATVARWLKNEGEPVQVGEPVVALETDKVDLEVGAKSAGVLTQIIHPEGDDVQVGAVLGIIDPAGEDAPAPAGEQPVENEPEMESTSEPAKRDDAAGESAPPKQSETGESAQAPDQGSPASKATPVARRMALDEGLDIAQIQPSGERVTKEDVQRYLASQGARGEAEPEQKAAAPVTTPAPKPGESLPGERDGQAPPRSEPLPASQAARPEERMRMSRRRRTIAARLVEAQQTAAMLTTFNDVNMSAVMDLRKRRQEAFQKRHGIKLGFMSFFVKAATGALKAFPNLNAEIQGDEIVRKLYYDIGMAIGAEEGLVVPVLRNAHQMSFAEIELAIRSYIEKSQAGTLSLEDLRGGTFSITNGGVYGSLLSTPILNPPQVGILGLHRIEDRPVAVDGQVVIRPMMYLALSYDHRIVDGSEAVQFLVRIKELIEDPENLLLEG